MNQEQLYYALLMFGNFLIDLWQVWKQPTCIVLIGFLFAYMIIMMIRTMFRR